MDLGTGITLSTTILTGGAVIVKWISASAKSNGNGNGKETSSVECPAHSGVMAILKVLTDGQEEIRADIKELLSRG